jgi:hypothetical protein
MCSKSFTVKARFVDKLLDKEISISDENVCDGCKSRFRDTRLSEESKTVMLDTFKKLLIAEKVSK